MDSYDWLSVIWKSDLTDKIKRSFFPCCSRVDTVIWMHYMKANYTYEEKLECNYTRMLAAILNKSWRQHPTTQQLYGHLTPITKTIKVRRTRNSEHYCRSKDEPISDILLWTPSHGVAKAGRSARTYIQLLILIHDVALKTTREEWTI